MSSVSRSINEYEGRQRALEMRELIEGHLKAFVDRYCVVERVGFVPQKLLHSAWIEYCVVAGILGTIDEYYKAYAKKFGMGPVVEDMDGISYDRVSGMYLGVRLVQWPALHEMMGQLDVHVRDG